MIPNVVSSTMGVEEGERKQRRLSWFVRFATWGSIAYSVCTPMHRLHSIVILPHRTEGLTDPLALSATRGSAGR